MCGNIFVYDGFIFEVNIFIIGSCLRKTELFLENIDNFEKCRFVLNITPPLNETSPITIMFD
jgi:hypothetical protein